jgi:hypothetical protein
MPPFEARRLVAEVRFRPPDATSGFITTVAGVVNVRRGRRGALPGADGDMKAFSLRRLLR